VSQEIHDPPKTPLGLHVVAWALAVVAVLLPVLLLVVDQRVLSGARDRNYFLTYTSDGSGNESTSLQPDIGFWDRWSVLDYTAPPERLLLASVAVCVVVAALHLAGGRRWPLHRGCRWLAVGAGASSAVCAAVVLVLDVLRLQVPEEDRRWYSTTSTLLDIAWPLSALGTVVVFGVVVGVVLLGPPAPRVEPERAAADDPGEPEPAPVVVGAEEVGAADEGAPEDREPVVAELPPAFPRPTAEEYAHYRRPGA
jgi:hypothetical protein